MNVTVNEVMLMEMIWQEIEQSARMQIGNEYRRFLQSQNNGGPVVDKLFTNTADYLLALAEMEGTTPDLVMQRAVTDSVQAHIAHHVSKYPQIYNNLPKREQVVFASYLTKRESINLVIDSSREFAVASAPQEGERTYRKRRVRNAVGAFDDSVVEPTAEVTTPSGTRRRRRTGTSVEQAPSTRRSSARSSETRVNSSTLMATNPVSPKPEMIITKTESVDFGTVIKRIEGEPMDYSKHQTVAIFDSSKPSAIKSPKFETVLRMAPVVKTNTVDNHVEVLLASPDDTTEELTPIQLVSMGTTPATSLLSACKVSRLRQSFEINSVSAINQWVIKTPIYRFSDLMSAKLAVELDYLTQIVRCPKVDMDFSNMGLVEWHARLAHAMELGESSVSEIVLANLNKVATAEFNLFLKYNLGQDASITDFVEDFPSFYTAVSAKIGKEKLDYLLGEETDLGENRVVIGAVLVNRLSAANVTPSTELKLNLSEENDDDDEHVYYLTLNKHVSIITLNCRSVDLGFAITSNNYNSITDTYDKDDTHVLAGIVRMFGIAFTSVPETQVYVYTTDDVLFHVRDIAVVKDGVPNVHIGIKEIPTYM